MEIKEMNRAERLRKLLGKIVVMPTFDECCKVLDELDKPELLPEHRDILQMLVDGKGDVTKVKGEWRVWPLTSYGRCDEGSTRDGTINTMIDLGLLDFYATAGNSGMTAYAYTTNAGIEALKQ